MPSCAEPGICKSDRRRPGAVLTIWNRKLHYYLGLYFLFFLWLFALTGLLLNHSAWQFQQFYPQRKVSKFSRAVRLPEGASDLDQARAAMRQLGIEGEIGWNAGRRDPRFLEFNVTRPGRVYQVQADIAQHQAGVTLMEFNVWGVVRSLHTFVGVSPDDPRNRRDWIPTTLWAFSMDAVAAGVAFMAFSGLYMWWGLREKRAAGMAALMLGVALCGLFVIGLRWIYG